VGEGEWGRETRYMQKYNAIFEVLTARDSSLCVVGYVVPVVSKDFSGFKIKDLHFQ
jgi:hypothetical protein